MSIMELIAEQKLIAITLAMAAVPLAIAGFILVFSVVRRVMNNMKEQREIARARKLEARHKAKKAQQIKRARRKAAAAAAKKRLLEQSEQETDDEVAYETAPAAPGSVMNHNSQPEIADETVEIIDENDEDEDEDYDEESETYEGGGSEMQELLDSVFDTSEEDQRYEVLLEGLDEIQINELEALAETVANQLRKVS